MTVEISFLPLPVEDRLRINFVLSQHQTHFNLFLNTIVGIGKVGHLSKSGKQTTDSS